MFKRSIRLFSIGNGDFGVSINATSSWLNPIFSQKLNLSIVADMNNWYSVVKKECAKDETSIGLIEIDLKFPFKSRTGSFTTKLSFPVKISILACAARSYLRSNLVIDS